MNKVAFENAKLIWSRAGYGINEYAEFCEKINYNGGKAVVRVSACGDYTLFVNGKYSSSNQFGDYAHYKVYDEIEVTDYLVKGENTLCFLGWYWERAGQRYSLSNAGIIYEMTIDGSVVLASSEKSLSRVSRAYKNGLQKKITSQLGFSFEYDANYEDNWLCGETNGFSKSAVIPNEFMYYKRPTHRLSVCGLFKGSVLKTENRYLVDLGKETVGLFSFKFVTAKAQKINVSYGELLENGRVKRVIQDRDFSFTYIAKSGINEYTNYMLRLACRYIEIESEYPIDIEYAGLLPQVYPVRERQINLSHELDRKIYDTCVNTLKLCMMEHYVDCPWREQCLYTFDSRNQMLSGCAAFEGGNFEYARANLLLMSKDVRPDGLLSICFPCGIDLTIPSFSLWYYVAVNEYMKFSKDFSLGEEVFDKLTSVMNVFVCNMKNGLICRFNGDAYWNFYDWGVHKDYIHTRPDDEPDFLMNSIAVMALNAYAEICASLGKENSFAGLSEAIAENAGKHFYDEKNKLFYISTPEEKPTEFANSLAVVSGIANGEQAKYICEKLASEELFPSSLSTKPFKFDALLMTGKNSYKTNVVEEIRRMFKLMLDSGSTTVWETEMGDKDFENAGSLCHGWSAFPVYYYRLFEE